MRYHAVSRLVPLYVGERRSILQAVLFSLGCLRLLGHQFDAIEADQMPYLPLFPLRLVASIALLRDDAGPAISIEMSTPLP